MICFGKSGLMVLRDSSGATYFFNPELKLSEVADYIHSRPTLSEYYCENTDSKPADSEAEVFYIEPQQKENSHRLRNCSPVMDDKYFQGSE